MSRNLRKKNVTILTSRKARVPKASPYLHLAELVPQKHHHMGISQSSRPKKNVTIWASRKARAPKMSPYGHFAELVPQKQNVTICASRKVCAKNMLHDYFKVIQSFKTHNYTMVYHWLSRT